MNDLENEKIYSNAPHLCPDCDSWLIGERLSTGDEGAYQGLEDWRYCRNCNYEAFYPLKLKSNS